MALRRIAKELEDIERNPHPSILNVGPISQEDRFNWQAMIIGPEGSPYENGKFLVEIKLREDYPFMPPKMRFLTKIFHPNFNEEGYVRLPELSERWSPALRVQHVLLAAI